jgi:acetylornithine deacetylase/succinyl-diaminopimelate desuccinylase-like protein
MKSEELQRYYSENEGEILDQWKEYLRFQSISTYPECDSDCAACAEWLSSFLGKLSFTTELLPTKGKPVVYARRDGKAGAPVVTFYGHYDVQPAEPLEDWDTPPFEPEVRDGKMYGRGAQDNKGQSFYVLKALEYLITNGIDVPTINIVIEGEEECGSPGIAEALPDWKERLQSDILLVCDTGTRAPEIATITMGLRGIIACGVKLKGAPIDLHSGVHGGAAPNPAAGVGMLIASLFNDDGSIAVEGYYDDVTPPSDEDLEAAKKLPWTSDTYRVLVGVEPTGGEQNLSVPERLGFRPTIEVNGLISGHTGIGMKTIIPSEAVLKLSSRLAFGQDPEKSLKQIIDHLKANTPTGLEFELMEIEEGGPAVRVSSGSKAVQVAREVLAEVSSEPVELLWLGASIPVITALAEVCGAEPVLVGFGLEEDSIHAPNESFRVEQFVKGLQFSAAYLSELALQRV